MTMPSTDGATTSPAWVAVCDVESVPREGGACVRFEGAQIAIFRVGRPEKWFAVQNRCPHWNEMVLSRAMTGAQRYEPKIACPMHKRSYSLVDGRCLSGDPLSLEVFEVREESGVVYLRRPPDEFIERERALAKNGRDGALASAS